jgi:hypothetical protein
MLAGGRTPERGLYRWRHWSQAPWWHGKVHERRSKEERSWKGLRAVDGCPCQTYKATFRKDIITFGKKELTCPCCVSEIGKSQTRRVPHGRLDEKKKSERSLSRHLITQLSILEGLVLIKKGQKNSLPSRQEKEVSWKLE